VSVLKSASPLVCNANTGTFTLGDDEEEEEMSLQSRRGQAVSKPAGE